MQFINPGFLYALIALAIPIIIHLFNFRRFKKIPFTNVRFLREIKLQTQNVNRLKHLLVLLARLLALAMIILAFAQPFIPRSDAEVRTGDETYSFFIDNSFSMEGEGPGGMLLEVARNRAIDISTAGAASDQFQALGQDFEARDQRLITQSAFRDRVQELELSPQSRDIASILDRQNDLLSDLPTGRSFILSDFQKSRFDFASLTTDSLIDISLVHIERNTEANLYIDSVWFTSPVRKLGAADEIHVRLANTGDEAVENIPIKLLINGSQKALGSFGIEAGGRSDTTLYFINEQAGIAMAEVKIDDYPVTFDDSYYFSFEVFEKIDVLNIRADLTSRDPFRPLFASDSSYTYKAVAASSVNYSELPDYSFIIVQEPKSIPTGLASELKNFTANGGSILVVPPADADFESYNDLFSQLGSGAILEWKNGQSNVRNLDLDHPLYRGIFEKIPRNLDLPIATTYAKLSSSVRSLSQSVLSFGNGDPFLQATPYQRGMVYVLTAPLSVEANNFSRHALFVASGLRMAELSRITAMRNVELDANSVFQMPAFQLQGDRAVHLIGMDRKTDIIPQFSNFGGAAQVTLGPEIQEAGLFYIISESDTLGGIGINYKRDESDIASYSLAELEQIASAWPSGKMRVFDGNSVKLVNAIEQDIKGQELWKICLFLALAFLLIESLLLRFWKKPVV